MSDFSLDFASPLASLASYFGDEIRFIRGDVELPVRKAVLSEEFEEATESPDGRRRSKVRWLQVVTDPMNDAYCGVTSWPVDSIVIIEKRRYQVASTQGPVAGATNVKLRQVSMASRSQPGIRGRDLPTVT